jgi:hypothetical protein
MMKLMLMGFMIFPVDLGILQFPQQIVVFAAGVERMLRQLETSSLWAAQ